VPEQQHSQVEDASAPSSHVAAWAAFLACSWTWCIGMFLPVLLWRDYGPWSFVAFALPNVVGAAAMGWVLREPGASERLISRHRGMCEAFSIVTRAFQFFFLVWLITSLESRTVAVLTIAAMALGALLGMRTYSGTRRVLVGSLVAFGGSVALLLAAAVRGGLRWPSEVISASEGSSGLVWLAPVCVFGFVFCPYLDLSFHHARQRSPGQPGSLAFALGFGVMFLALILGTLFYAWMFLDAAGLFASGALRTAVAALVCAHIGLQLGFTIEVHKAEVRLGGSSASVTESEGWAWGGIGMAAGTAAAFLPSFAGLSAGEAIYRGFMAFYGLVFPAYVWLCVIPTRDGHSGPSRQKLLTWAVTLALAGPMFWMGFIQRQNWWLGPGLVVVLVSRLAVIPRAGRQD
jgi:hypothetical protein